MSEIRDRVRQKAIEILIKPLKIPYQTDAAEMMVQGAINQAEEILSISELAIVDRKANREFYDEGHQVEVGIPEGWVKEVK